MRKWWPAFVIASAIAVVVSGIYISKARLDKGSKPRGPAPVRTAEARPPTELRVTGRIEPQHVVPVPAPMDGKVMEMAVEPGQAVFEGQLLARVVSSGLDLERESALTELERAKSRVLSLRAQIDDQRLAISRARAAAVRAEEDALARRKVFDRQQFLFTESATPRLVYEKSRREYEQAKLESDALEAGTQQADDHLRQLIRDLNSAQKVLDLRSAELDNLSEQAGAGQVLSPVTGVVIDVHAHAGDTVTPGMTDMIQLATDLSDLQVHVLLNASGIAWLKPGTPALIEIAESAGEPIDGVVKSINGTDAVVAFTTANAAIRPGLSALVRLRSR